MSNEIMKREEIGLAQMQGYAKAMVDSKLFGFKSEAEAMGIMLLCQADGLSVATAVRDYHIVTGRPCLRSEAMLARFQRSGGVISWQEMSDTRCAAYFSHPQSSPTPLLVEWTMERAKTAGLNGKDNWRKYPRQMLKARCISDGVRAVYPVCNSGTYTPEEAHDMEPMEAPRAPVAMPKVIEATTVDTTTTQVETVPPLVEQPPADMQESPHAAPVDDVPPGMKTTDANVGTPERTLAQAKKEVADYISTNCITPEVAKNICNKATGCDSSRKWADVETADKALVALKRHVEQQGKK